jgi:hypothetical protein
VIVLSAMAFQVVLTQEWAFEEALGANTDVGCHRVAYASVRKSVFLHKYNELYNVDKCIALSPHLLLKMLLPIFSSKSFVV